LKNFSSRYRLHACGKPTCQSKRLGDENEERGGWHMEDAKMTSNTENGGAAFSFPTYPTQRARLRDHGSWRAPPVAEVVASSRVLSPPNCAEPPRGEREEMEETKVLLTKKRKSASDRTSVEP
jgi:hypothetical protein